MIHRIDVRTRGDSDPGGGGLHQQVEQAIGTVGRIETWRIFLLDSEATPAQIQQAGEGLLADLIVEEAVMRSGFSDAPGSRVEIHLKPGVMDPVATSTAMALADMGIPVREVRTGRAYVFTPPLQTEQLQRLAQGVLANGVIESVHFKAYHPAEFPAARQYVFALRHVPLRQLTDDALQRLSREAHLFLSLEEMQAVQKYFDLQQREPTDIELETLAQTWSEHCVHKTLKSAVELTVRDEAGNVRAQRSYSNLIKETIFKSTMDLTAGGTDQSFCLSVFADNAGVIAFDEEDAVCFKVETHNHPSAIEPYGGSATGAGGVIRDILGTGLGARPIANTDVFCVAFPNQEKSLPRGVIHPQRVLRQIVAGVRDYGNRMGISTVNGAVYFDDRYLGNPLVFCGCVGLIPRNKVQKKTLSGDAIVVMGGRTGRDGIHGATFSSAELTDTHADEFSHAVQIGNAITEKKMADVILQARDAGLFTAITDCGAGGLSSAVGEMAQETGASVQLEKVPLKYAGLRYDEIWISEAQERMVLSVPIEQVEPLLQLCRSEDVEATVIGTFGTERRELVLEFAGAEVGRISMDFLHNGLPKRMRQALVIERGDHADGDAAAQVPVEEIERPSPEDAVERRGGSPPPTTVPAMVPVSATVLHRPTSTGFPPLSGTGADLGPRVAERLLATLSHPNIASKHWIIRQYDHEVQGGSVIKPLVGPLQRGPSDAAVIRPKLHSYRGVAIACGLAPHVTDPYRMAIAAIDEAIRNVIAIGAEPGRMAILDNFCWPSVDDEITMGTLVRACEACHDAAREFGIPFISGKDSLHNQFTNSETGQVLRIPNTLLISAIAVIQDVRQCLTMDFKQPGHHLGIVRQLDPEPDLVTLASTHRLMAQAIAAGQIVSCHDISDGGMLAATAEMAIASDIGVDLRYPHERFFTEIPGEYLFEFDPSHTDALRDHFGSLQTSFETCGELIAEPHLRIANYRQVLATASIDTLATAWRKTLDWS